MLLCHEPQRMLRVAREAARNNRAKQLCHDVAQLNSLEDIGFVHQIQLIGRQLLRMFGLVRMDDEYQAIAIAAVFMVRENLLTLVVGTVVNRIIPHRWARRNRCGEIFVLRNESDPLRLNCART